MPVLTLSLSTPRLGSLARRIAPVLALALAALLTAAAIPARAADAPGGEPDELLVGFHGGVSDADADGAHRSAGARRVERVRGLNVDRVSASAASGEATARALARDPRVKFVERNRRVSPDFAVNDPSFGNQWHLAKIAAPTAWDVAPGAPGIVVAVVDSGVDGTHPDLAGRLVAGYNFFSSNIDTSDVYGHGTLVAGTVAAAGNNGTGVSGVAWRSQIMPVRVSDATGVAYISAIANGIIWAVDRGARVVNVSFSGVAGSPTIMNAAQYARSKGAVVVASAGNCGCVDATAENVYVLSVSATDQNDGLATFSSRGNYVDVSAPGVTILTTARGGGYAWAQGTSFSSPVVAGVVALMMQTNAALLPAELVTLVKANADDRGALGWDPSFGFGRVNAYRAVAAAVASTPPTDAAPPAVAVTAPAAAAMLSGAATVTVAASDSGSINRVDLYVDGVLLGSDTTAPYSFAWDTRNAANGAHALVAKAVDAAGNVGTSPAVAVTVDNALVDSTRPTARIISTSKSATALTVNASATDNVAVTRVELLVDGVLKATRPTAPYTFAVDLAALAAGNHNVYVRAWDAAGNGGSSNTVRFKK
jgi:subtilisin family serine protease